MKIGPSRSTVRALGWSFLSLSLIGGMFFLFLRHGLLGVLRADVPPVERLVIPRVIFTPEHIELRVFNDGPEPVTVAQVVVNKALWRFTMIPKTTLLPLHSGRVDLFYPWTEGYPLSFKLISRSGIVAEKEVGVAFLTPTFDLFHIRTFVLLGLYVGVIPVLLGLLWFPMLRRMRGELYSSLLALTVGLLAFLGFDTFAEGLRLVSDVPSALNGAMLLIGGIFLAIIALGVVSHRMERVGGGPSAGSGSSPCGLEEHLRSLAWGYLIALGIGIHNLGEGLAIGSAYALGEVALGGSLVIGFMLHNLTEGVAIVAPLTRTVSGEVRLLRHLVAMGLLAGGPTVFGTFLGGFAYSPVLGVLFLGIGTGAIFDVTFDILHHMAGGKWKALFTGGNVLGFLLGLLLMYGTGFLVVR